MTSRDTYTGPLLGIFTQHALDEHFPAIRTCRESVSTRKMNRGTSICKREIRYQISPSLVGSKQKEKVGNFSLSTPSRLVSKQNDKINEKK